MRQGALPRAVGTARATGTRASVEERERWTGRSLQNALKRYGNRSGISCERSPHSEGSPSEAQADYSGYSLNVGMRSGSTYQCAFDAQKMLFCGRAPGSVSSSPAGTR